VTGSCERGNGPSGFIKCEGFLDLLRNCQLIKDSAAWRWLVLVYHRFIACKFCLL
jgi:hypothetical protein